MLLRRLLSAFFRLHAYVTSAAVLGFSGLVGLGFQGGDVEWVSEAIPLKLHAPIATLSAPVSDIDGPASAPPNLDIVSGQGSLGSFRLAKDQTASAALNWPVSQLLPYPPVVADVGPGAWRSTSLFPPVRENSVPEAAFLAQFLVPTVWTDSGIVTPEIAAASPDSGASETTAPESAATLERSASELLAFAPALDLPDEFAPVSRAVTGVVPEITGNFLPVFAGNSVPDPVTVTPGPTLPNPFLDGPGDLGPLLPLGAPFLAPLDAVSDVPEPAGLLLLVAGGVAFLLLRRKSRHHRG